MTECVDEFLQFLEPHEAKNNPSVAYFQLQAQAQGKINPTKPVQMSLRSCRSSIPNSWPWRPWGPMIQSPPIASFAIKTPRKVMRTERMPGFAEDIYIYVFFPLKFFFFGEFPLVVWPLRLMKFVSVSFFFHNGKKSLSLKQRTVLGPGHKSKDDDEENMDRRRKPIEPLPRVNHEEIDYPAVEFGFYKPHPECLGRCSDST